jgi:hypothetical protein
MADRGIIKSIVVVSHDILMTHTNCQPAAAALLDLESHTAWTVAVLVQGWLQKPEVIVVPLCRLDEIIRNHRYSVMLQFLAKSEVRFAFHFYNIN